MNIPPYATIVVSYISYEPQTIALNGRNNLHIRMEEKSLALEQVVVTAMGIQKKMSSLTYSTQQISSSELTRAKEPNMINTLAGKTAGVQINKSRQFRRFCQSRHSRCTLCICQRQQPALVRN